MKDLAQIMQQAQAMQAKMAEVQAKIDKLYNAMVPLLNNLKKNPEKEYILWPNRVEKVEQFQDYLYEIYKS